MRIGILSDLHIDGNEKALPEGQNYEKLLSRLLKKQQVDQLLLAGDISSDYRVSQEFLNRLQDESGVPVLFVPGNHDFWSKKNGVTQTKDIYDFFQRQPESLIARPRILNDEWAVVGSPGWYDYGYGNHNMYSLKKFSEKKYRFASWNDRHYIDWGLSDREVSRRMLRQLESDLSQVGDRKVILMTHVATHPEFVVPLPHKIYDYFNAFLGSASYEALYEKYPIALSVMGHVHFRKTYRTKETTFVSACLGNKKHWRSTDPADELEQTLVTMDL